MSLLKGAKQLPLFRPESLKGAGMVFIGIILRILSNHTSLPSPPALKTGIEWQLFADTSKS